MRWLAAIAFALLCACGSDKPAPDIVVGPTNFYFHTVVWPDIWEATESMQRIAPNGVFDLDVHLWQPRSQLVDPPFNWRCLHWNRVERIDAFVTGNYVDESCLPHEFAHEWDTRVHTSTVTHHDFTFDAYEKILKDAAGKY